MYVLGLGTIPSLEQWEKDLQACYLPYGEQGKDPDHLIRMGVGEVKLYKLMFPKECLNQVMGIIGEDPGYVKKYDFVRKKINWIRSLLKLKEAPKPTKIYKHMLPNKVNKAVAIIPIGTREDVIGDNNRENI